MKDKINWQEKVFALETRVHVLEQMVLRLIPVMPGIETKELNEMLEKVVEELERGHRPL